MSSKNKNSFKHLSTITITIVFLFSIVQASNFKPKIRNNPQTVPTVSSPAALTYSSPWWIDSSTPTVCDSNVVLEPDVMVNGVSQSSLILNFHGGMSSTACFSYSTPTLSLSKLMIKIKSIAQVYELGEREWCGSFSIIETPADPLHPEIKNGISCHCPGGVNDYKFSQCTDPAPDSQNMTFYNSLPSSSSVQRVSLCHNVVTRGTAKGCLFDQDASTDYSLKFRTVWTMHPIFKLRTRPILETLFGVYIEEVACPPAGGSCTTTVSEVGSFNVSTLTSQMIKLNIAGNLINFMVDYGSIKPLSDLLPDYVISSATGNFLNADDIYLMDKDDFNLDDDLNPLKLCPLRKVENNPLQYAKWELDTALKDAFSADQCHNPAKGMIQSPFQKLEAHQFEANKLTHRLNPEIVDFMPQGQAILKIRSQAAVTIYLKINPASSVAISEVQDWGSVTDFQITCGPSYNEEGYPCSTILTCDGKSRVELQTLDTEQTITSVDVIADHQSFKFFLPYSVAGENDTSICAVTVGATICHKVTLINRFTDPIVEPNVTGTEDDFNNQGGGNIFKDGSGKLHTWIIVIIVIASCIAFIIMIVLCMPLLKFLRKLIAVFFKYLGTKLHHMKKNAVSLVDQEVEPEKPKFTI